MLRRPILILLACTAVLLTSMVQAKPLNVSLVISDNSPPYRQFADSFSRHLAASHAEVNIVESLAINGTPADLIVAVGMKAAVRATAQAEIPVLVAMIPDDGYRELLAQISAQKIKPMISAIYLSQPLDRRIDFMRAALPKLHRVGLLYSPGTPINIENLRKEVEKRGGSLVAQPVKSSDRLFSVLDSVLAGSDVLLGIPDSAIYSGGNIRNILLTSYRHNVPLIGISKAYVNAGALCAVFSTPEQLAGQTSAAVISFARDSQLPAPQYPADFTIEVNRQVARSLGIELPSEEAIRAQMDRERKQ